MDITAPVTLEEWNLAGTDYLPGLLGMRFVKVQPDEVVATLDVRRALGAWNGYLHAGRGGFIGRYVLWLWHGAQLAHRG